MTGGWVTDADRARWQRQAASRLAVILDSHAGLPVIAWAIGPSGTRLTGSVDGAVPAECVRAAFAAWQGALGLDDVSETACDGGTVVWLRARAWCGGVRVAVTATVRTHDGLGARTVTS